MFFVSQISRTVGLAALVTAGVLFGTTQVAVAGPYAAPGAGTSRYTSPDCSQLTPSADPIPFWSRLQWSIGAGPTWRRADGRWDGSFAVASHAGAALWMKEWACKPGTSGLWDSPQSWVRWSVAATGDVLWRVGDGTDMRPALRLSRARMESGLLGGSVWVPRRDVWFSVGPTFDPSWNGAAAGLGFSALGLFAELRGALHDDSQEVSLMVGFTDLHGWIDLGPARS